MEECLISLRVVWNDIFASVQGMDPEAWATKYLKEPQHTLQLLPLSGHDLHQAALTMKRTAAEEADNWQPSKLAKLPSQAFRALVDIFNYVESAGLWLQQQKMIWLAGPLAPPFKRVTMGSPSKSKTYIDIANHIQTLGIYQASAASGLAGREVASAYSRLSKASQRSQQH